MSLKNSLWRPHWQLCGQIPMWSTGTRPSSVPPHVERRRLFVRFNFFLLYFLGLSLFTAHIVLKLSCTCNVVNPTQSRTLKFWGLHNFSPLWCIMIFFPTKFSWYVCAEMQSCLNILAACFGETQWWDLNLFAKAFDALWEVMQECRAHFSF